MSSLPKISVSLLIFFSSLAASGEDPYRLSAGAGEAGKAFVCIIKDGFWSSFHNQAILAGNNSFSIGFNYENRFNISELGTRSVAMIIPGGKTSVGVIYSNFGYTDFKREMTGLACGIKLTNKIAAGLQVDYFSERTAGEYSNIKSITCEIGLIVTPSENTKIGFHLFNPVPNSLRKTFLPTSLRIGAGTNLNKLLFTGIEAEMYSGSNLIFRIGFEYEVAKKLRMRGGFCSDNNSFSFGLGTLLKLCNDGYRFCYT